MSYPEYEQFLRAKMVQAPERGITIDASSINPLLKPHQAAIVRWACAPVSPSGTSAPMP